ncbi:MAG: sporulation protein YabP [Clostridia bacterium]|nr:sporulation protein YabP [Clostridia bacterium]
METVSSRQTGNSITHNLTLEARQKAALSGVKEVIAFDDGQVILQTDAGEITLTGQGMHVTRLMLTEGELTVEGSIDGIFYTDKKEKKRRLRNSL